MKKGRQGKLYEVMEKGRGDIRTMRKGEESEEGGGGGQGTQNREDRSMGVRENWGGTG